MGLPGQPENERRYSDKELAFILKLAAEQEGEPDAGSGWRGPSATGIF